MGKSRTQSFDAILTHFCSKYCTRAAWHMFQLTAADQQVRTLFFLLVDWSGLYCIVSCFFCWSVYSLGIRCKLYCTIVI